MEQHAHLTRLFGGIAQPLTLLAQSTGAATANAGRIHHAQDSIGFWASLMDQQRLAGWATQGSIWLEGKISTGEAARASCAEPPLVAHILVQEKGREIRLRVQASRQGPASVVRTGSG